MGLHREARDGYEMWLDRVEKPVPPPDGLWTGGPGRFFSGIEWDNAHGGGISLIHIRMLEHFLLTRDRPWLAKNAPKLNANADWIVRQRKEFWKGIPGHERLWTNGLLPPHNIWDSRRWRSWYQSNASYCYALMRHAEVIAAVDPEAGRRFAKEARDFRNDLLAAVEKSLTLSPVIRVRDGTYHSFLPPFPYLRGPASRFMPVEFGGMHTPGLYPDAIAGAQSVADFRLLPAGDPRMQGYMDVLEDRLLSENFKLYLRFPDYDPQKDWFSRSGWYYQPYAERTANHSFALGRSGLLLAHLAEPVRRAHQPGGMDVPRAHGRPPGHGQARRGGRLPGTLPPHAGDGGGRLALAGPGDAAGMAGAGQEDLREECPHGLRHAVLRDRLRRRTTARSRRRSKCRRAIRPHAVLLRLRHPQAVPIKGVAVNGRPWTDFDAAKEVIRLHDLQGTVQVEASY